MPPELVAPGQTHWIADLKIKIYAESVSTANSALVAEATGSTLPLTELEGEDAGDYYVVVSNIAGEVTSDTATLTVDLPPTVTQLSALSNADGLDLSATAEVEGEELLTYEWSQNGSFLAGGDIDLVATVIGTEPISYQWYYKDLPVDGAKGNTLRLAKAGVDASGDYHVVVFQPAGHRDTSDTVNHRRRCRPPRRRSSPARFPPSTKGRRSSCPSRRPACPR